MKGAKLLLYMTTQLRQIRISLLSFLTKLSSRLRPGTDLFFHLDLIVCLLIQTRDVKITKTFSDKKILGVFRSRCIKPLLLKKISVRSLICIENVKIEVIFFKINLTHHHFIFEVKKGGHFENQTVDHFSDLQIIILYFSFKCR